MPPQRQAGELSPNEEASSTVPADIQPRDEAADEGILRLGEVPLHFQDPDTLHGHAIIIDGLYPLAIEPFGVGV